jgi:hypothetical protein
LEWRPSPSRKWLRPQNPLYVRRSAEFCRLYHSSSAKAAWQCIVDAGSGNRGVAGGNAQLMQVGHNVTCRIKTIDSRLLFVVHLDAADRIAARAKCFGKLRMNVASESWVNDIKMASLAAFKGRLYSI